MSTTPGTAVFAAPEAAEPPEARGLGRDEVRLLAARRADGALTHAVFRDLPTLLEPGDLLVVNRSATLPAALPARGGGGALDLHLSTPVPAALPVDSEDSALDLQRSMPVPADGAGGPLRWVVELRRGGSRLGGRAGEGLALPGGGRAQLVAPYLGTRLWVADLALPEPLEPYLARHGAPIRYGHTPHAWPLSDYQTIFSEEPGSAEMPSAARPFTPRVLAGLEARGVGLASIVLHTGVSSLERGEAPYPERFRVPAATAERVHAARRVIAVGTTVVRALETSGGEAAAGWTRHVVTPERPPRVVDGLITGWHDPEASHLLMLEALAGRDLVERSYAEAAAADYLRHEFGDSHLLL
jgi:S-adenosylmethionine:tRNA ribosyltransferase-isomerase